MSWKRPPQTRYASIAVADIGPGSEPDALGEPIVCDDVGAGYEARGRAREEHHYTCNLFRGAHATRRNGPQRRFVELRIGALDHFPGTPLEVDGTGRHGIYAHILSPDELRQLFRVG